MLREFFKEESSLTTSVVLGAEEQTDTLLLAQEALTEVESFDADVSRALDIAEGLEGLVFVAGKLEGQEIQPVHRAFFDNGLNLALAGTGIESAEIAPSLESDQDLTVSVESVKKTIDSIWKTIQKVLASMWQSIQNFWKRIKAAFGGVEKAAKELIKDAEERTNYTASEKTFSGGRNMARLCVEGKSPTKSSDIIDGLNDINQLVTYCTSTKVKELKDCAKDMIKNINDFDFNSTAAAEASLGKLAASCDWDGEKLKKAVKPTKVTRDTRWNASDTVEAIHLPGDKSLFCIERAKLDNEGTLGMAERVRKESLVFTDTTQKKDSKKDNTDMNVFEVAGVISIGNAVVSIMEEVGKYDDKDLKKAADDLKKASNTMKGKFDKAVKEESGRSGASAYIDSALKFNVEFSRWSTKVGGQLTSHAVTTCRAALSVARSNLSQYKKDAE